MVNRKHLFALAIGGIALGPIVRATNAETIVIDPTNAAANGWVFTYYDGNGNVIASPGAGYSGSFVTGPSTPPLGSGSVRLTTGTDGAAAVKISTNNFNGIKLSSITQLSYSTYVTQNNGGN